MKSKSKVMAGLLLGGVVCIASTANVLAQETNKTVVQDGTSTSTTQVERGEVVYVAGNDLVVKMSTGEVRHLVVPDNARATVEGKELSVRDLKPGMKLQRTITTTTTPRTVTNIRSVEGKIWSVSIPNSLILSFADGSPNKQYKIPKDQKFIVGGQVKTAFDLKKDMQIAATVVSESTDTIVSETRAVTGNAAPAPAPKPVAVAPPPPTPVLIGVLLIEMPAPAPAPAPVAARPAPAPAPAPRPAAAAPAPAPEPAPTALPKTASPLPLVGLLGIVLCAASFGLKLLRRSAQ